MRILFVFITLVQWSIYTLGSVVFLSQEEIKEDNASISKSSCNNEIPACSGEQPSCSSGQTTCSKTSNSCSEESDDCSKQDDKACCNSIICLTICYPLQTGPLQEALQSPNGIELLATRNAGYLVWIPNPYPEIFSPPPDQLL